MKENKYNDDAFFEKYNQMERSKGGLAAAGEWETLKTLLPNFANTTVLDLGCGYGWHCIYAIEQGAKQVVGVDISSKMLAVAEAKTKSPKVKYICQAMEDIDFPPETFDIIISSLALHYIKDYQFVIAKIAKCLKTNGHFIFSCEHPVFTAEGSQDWIYDENNKILHFPVDNYYLEGSRETTFLGEKVTKYHRTLTTYIKGLQANGLRVDQIVEPMPTKEAVANIPGMVDELRRPMMLIITCTRV